MKRFKVHLFSSMVATVLISLLLTTMVAQAQAAPWTVVKSPNASSGNNELFGAASVSAKDVWAVGDFTTTSGVKQTLTLHWNGHKWRVVASPNASSGNNTLLGVAAVSTTDVWAVGSFITASGSGQALIEHWNGTSWSVVKSPGAGTSNILLGVAAVSTTDVWAVGGFVLSGFGPVQTLIEHWDGTSWSVVSSPNASTQTNELLGVTAVSASDIWAVGEFVTSGGLIQTLIEHWNGTSWSVVSSPNPSTQDTLQATAAVSPTDVWAVGDFVAASGVEQALIEHWNGTSWSVVSSPSPGGVQRPPRAGHRLCHRHLGRRGCGDWRRRSDTHRTVERHQLERRLQPQSQLDHQPPGWGFSGQELRPGLGRRGVHYYQRRIADAHRVQSLAACRRERDSGARGGQSVACGVRGADRRT